MSADRHLYDLVLVIDPELEEGARAKIVADSRAAIEADGELVRHDEWGERPLAYPIQRRKSGIYHLVQFHPGSAALLESLQRTLHITDGVLRFRVVKLPPASAAASETAPAAPRASAPQAARTDAERQPAEVPAGEPA